MMCPSSGITLDTKTLTSSRTAELTKPNDLLVMVPVIGRLRPVSRKLFNALLKVGSDQYRRRVESGSPMLATELFEAKMSDLLAHLPGESFHWLTDSKRYLIEMMDIQVVWEAIDRHSTASEWGAMRLLSQASIQKKGNVIHVKWAFPPRLLELLNDPALYTRLDLEVIGQLRTYTAIALYEICSRYRTNPSGVTCSQSPDWWVDALTGRSSRQDQLKARGVDSPHEIENEKPRREWRKVKSESVLDAIEEINSKTDLEIELIEKRVGKAVSEVQFGVRRKRRAVQAGQGIAPDVLERAVSLGISAADISTICRNARGGVDVVKAALSKLSERVARDDLMPLSNVTAYLKTILGELDEYVESGPIAGLSPSSGARQPMNANTLRSTPPTEVVDLVETPESLAKRQIEALDRPAQEILAKAAFERMQEKGMATAAVVQAYAKYMSGGPLAGVLLGEMTRQQMQQVAPV